MFNSTLENSIVEVCRDRPKYFSDTNKDPSRWTPGGGEYDISRPR